MIDDFDNWHDHRSRFRGNEISPGVWIDEGVKMGQGNIIEHGVTIGGFKDGECDIVIGDNNHIHYKSRILVNKLRMGNDNIIHHHTSFLAGEIEIGNDCWIAEYTRLDGTGGLTLGNNVATSYETFIWTHAGHSKLDEGSLLVNTNPTIIKDHVWMVGCNVVINPGLTIGHHSVIFANSVVTKDTMPWMVYAGNPARRINVKAWEQSP